VDMRTTISKNCNLEFLTEKRNNEDPSDMSFGVAVFHRTTPGQVKSYYGNSILDEGYGSVAVGVKFMDDSIYWGIHFPIDFKNHGKDNYGYKAITGLQTLMDTYTGSVCAFGDFNTIPGHILDAIELGVRTDDYSLISNSDTFFGAYYDTIPAIDEWTELKSEPSILN